MNVFIVYCHPSSNSFTSAVFESFKRGVKDSGHTYTASDLYAMNFTTDMSELEYLRDAYYTDQTAPAADVLAEQEKINNSDAIVFIYPVFWTEAPAKLVGWFDRVWSYGFAYGEKRMKLLEKALILCTAGNKIIDLERFGLLAAMKKVMLGDRLFNRVKKSSFIVFDGMSREFSENRKNNTQIFLEQAYHEGLYLFTPSVDAFSLDGKNFTAIENSATLNHGSGTAAKKGTQ